MPTAAAASTVVVRGELGLHDLDERHQRRRVEEVHADDALGPGRRGRDLGHRERRGVGREDRVGPADPVELGEELALRLELLDDRLDHEVAVGERLELGRRRQPRNGRVAIGLLELALLDLAREEVPDPAGRRLAELGRHLAADRVVAGLDRELRDAAAHGAEADHADRADLRHAADPRAWRRGSRAGSGSEAVRAAPSAAGAGRPDRPSPGMDR